MPSRPRLATVEASQTTFKTWDQYVQEAAKPPFPLVMGADDVIEVVCPTSAEMLGLVAAQNAQDLDGICAALFKENADRMYGLLLPQPFTLVQALVNDIMIYFGVGADQQGESDASSRK